MNRVFVLKSSCNCGLDLQYVKHSCFICQDLTAKEEMPESYTSVNKPEEPLPSAEGV